MDLPLETPSRILRRIKALEAEDMDLPSLPSFPAYDDSGIHSSFRASTAAPSISRKDIQKDLVDISEEHDEMLHESTPAAPSTHGTKSTIRPPSTTSSAGRFANSLRSSNTRKSPHQSFEVSRILPSKKDYDIESEPSLPNIYVQPSYLPNPLEMTPALSASEQILHPSMHTSEIRSRTRSPLSFHSAPTPRNAKYDYSVSLREDSSDHSPPGHERNMSNRGIRTRTRTPSLSRTTPSPPSTSPNSTPKSFHSPRAFDRELHSPSPNSSEHLDLQADSNSRQQPDLPDNLQNSQSEERSSELDNGLSSKSVTAEEVKTGLRHHLLSGVSPSVSVSEEHQGSGSSSSSSSSSGGGGLARTPYPNAFSSPMNADSPVPALPFTHRARFAAQETPIPISKPEHDDLTTPYNRRRSFLLELVNSNARPRMTFPTPHPFARGGVTPRPRAHPLSQAWTPSPEPSHPSSGSDAESDSPKNRNSFISTASSHDLTVHPRANASFDPTTGVQGVGRFNAPKLNLYMHSLNRQLQEENRVLVERLRKLGEEVELNKFAEQLESNEIKRMEDAAAAEVEGMRQELQRHDLEKEALEQAFEAELQSLQEEKVRLEKDLQEERDNRQEDNLQWKARLAERLELVNKGVEETLSTMELKLDELTSRKTETENKLRQCEQTILALDEDLELAKRRAEKAETALANKSDLGIELQKANQLIGSLKEEVRSADSRAKEYQLKLKEVEEREALAEEQIEEIDNELRQALEGQQNAEANVLETQTELEVAQRDIERLRSELSTAQGRIAQLAAQTEDLHVDLKRRETEGANSQNAVHQLQVALKDSEEKMIEDKEELQALRAKVERLEKEIEQMQAARTNLSTSTVLNRTREEKRASNSEFEQLEAELDEAHKEIGKLNHLLAQSPARRAIDAAKDVRIELLEKERDGLIERVKSLGNLLAASPVKLSTPKFAMNTPAARKASAAWKTPKTPGPLPKEYSWLQDRTSLTDASPLLAQIQVLQEELHNANNSIDEKVNKLEDAGMGIVGLTEKLEDARARTTALEDEVGRLVRREERRTRRLERVKCLECGVRIDIITLIGSDSGEKSLDLSASMHSNPVTPPSKKLASLRIALQAKTTELDALRAQWETARADILGQNAILEDRANALNRELEAAKAETKKMLASGRRKADEQAAERINVEAELAKAKSIVSDLEETLRQERVKLRSLTTEQQQIQREKENVFVQLQRAQSDMDDVRTHLEAVKNENKKLESELQVMAIVDSKARHLQVRVAENYKTIELLRSERETLMADHASLQQHHQDISSRLNRLRQQFSASHATHQERTHQLDLKVNEIEDLRRELTERNRVVEKITSEKNQAHAERSDILRTVARLQGDLKRVRRDAEMLGKDLKELRSERDKMENKHRDELNQAERVQKQLSAQIRLANEQLEVHRIKAKKALADLHSHVCKTENQDMNLLRIQHKNECKGLMVQIHYLKAKFTRESTFRADLTYQKHYLLEVLSKFEKGERQIIAAIARLDFPMHKHPKPSRKRKSLRTIAVAVRFLCRAKRMNASWKEQTTNRTAINAALTEVRKKRKAITDHPKA